MRGVGRERSRRRTTASARRWVRIRSRGWCASSSASSATKRARSAASCSAATIPTSSSRASAAGRTRSARSPGSSTPDARLVGVEAGGLGLETGHHGAAVSRGVPGVVHGMRSLFLQDEYGQVLEATSISAGLDYPGRRSRARDARRAAAGPSTTPPPTTKRSPGSSCSSATEGIVPALEPAHAIGWLAREAGHAVPTGSTVLRHAVGPRRQGRGAGRRAARRDRDA